MGELLMHTSGNTVAGVPRQHQLMQHQQQLLMNTRHVARSLAGTWQACVNSSHAAITAAFAMQGLDKQPKSMGGPQQAVWSIINYGDCLPSTELGV